jgi:hypothetical protein
MGAHVRPGQLWDCRVSLWPSNHGRRSSLAYDQSPLTGTRRMHISPHPWALQASPGPLVGAPGGLGAQHGTPRSAACSMLRCGPGSTPSGTAATAAAAAATMVCVHVYCPLSMRMPMCMPVCMPVYIQPVAVQSMCACVVSPGFTPAKECAPAGTVREHGAGPRRESGTAEAHEALRAGGSRWRTSCWCGARQP